MVARSPPKLKKMVAPINPLLLRETLTKVDRCMSRLQELQYTVRGGSKVISSGVNRSSLRCKQETLSLRTPKKSPAGKFPTNTEWRRMSLPAMLLGETVGEIIQASQFAKEIVEAVNAIDDPKTPMTQRRKQRPDPDNTELRTRRKREKQSTNTLSSIRSPKQPQRVRSRINFKVSSPPKKIETDDKEENGRYLANRVSPKLKPWAKKTVLFPNPLFLSTTPSKKPMPHKFLIKSPPSANKFQVKIKKSPTKVSLSPTRPPKAAATPSKLRRSFSPSRFASRLVSPLKSRKNMDGSVMSGLRQRPALVSMRHSIGGSWRN